MKIVVNSSRPKKKLFFLGKEKKTTEKLCCCEKKKSRFPRPVCVHVTGFEKKTNPCATDGFVTWLVNIN